MTVTSGDSVTPCRINQTLDVLVARQAFGEVVGFLKASDGVFNSSSHSSHLLAVRADRHTRCAGVGKGGVSALLVRPNARFTGKVGRRPSGVLGTTQGERLTGKANVEDSHSSHPSEDLFNTVGANGAYLVAGVGPHVTPTVSAGRCSGFGGR